MEGEAQIKSKKLGALMIPLLLIISVIGVAPVISGSSAGDQTSQDYAKKILDTADGARLRVESLASSLMNNQSAVSSIINGALAEGEQLLQRAHESFLQGNYSEAVSLSMEAMDAFREAYIELAGADQNLNQNQSQSEIQAQGLLVAASCTLERIQRMNESLSNITVKIDEARAYLAKAEQLLNPSEIQSMLQQGNATAVAQRIAEANRLMSQASEALRIKAQERMQLKVDQYLEKMEKNRERLMERLNATGINATELFTEFGFRNMGEFNQAMNSLKEMVKNDVAQGKWNEAMGALKSMANLTQKYEFNFQKRLKSFPVPTPTPALPSQPQGTPELQVSLKKLSIGSTLTLVVTINNTGSATIVFPNTAYGATIEKSSDGGWINYYSPISAQVIVSLKPGQSGKINITFSLQQPLGSQGTSKGKGNVIQPNPITSGEYRVAVHGWVQGTYDPVVASSEFTVP